MKCPHCGSDMRQDQVFCENCGKERLLVPVFEPEIEDSVAESMSTIVQELSPDEQSNREKADGGGETDRKETDRQEPDRKESDRREPGVERRHGMKQVNFLVTAVIALIIFISAFSIIFYIYTENSYDYQYQKAETAYHSGELEEALRLADRCLELNPDSVDARMLKILVYQEQGQTDMVVERTLALIARDPDNQQAYEILIPIYIEQGQYQKLSALLAACPVQSVAEKYADYLAIAPEFGTEEGVYTASVSLKLIASGTGNIYYTLDGTVPSKYSDRYTAPIKLISGDYQVSAVYINNYGVSSEVVTKEYEIINDIELLPEISADSGEYTVPVTISVSVPDQEYTVYYTTDGTVPTLDSNIYSSSFTMPLGHSEYRFLMVDADGNESEVVSRSYDCNPETNYTTDQACLILKQNLIARGEILDINGTMAGSEDRKEYLCDSAAEADGVVYYVIYEYLQNPSGTMIRTGNVYAFSVLDGQLKKASVSETGKISLSEF